MVKYLKNYYKKVLIGVVRYIRIMRVLCRQGVAVIGYCRYCVCCQQYMMQNYQLCKCCWEELRCQLWWHQDGQIRARVVTVGETSDVDVRYLLDYDGLAKYLVVQLKYHNGLWAVPVLAGLLSVAMRIEIEEGVRGDEYGIVAVPMHANRRYQRGYNQAAVLASYSARKMGIRFFRHGLVRNQDGRQQQGLGRRQRQKNVQHVFQAQAGLPKAIILIDDVVTTGATLHACIRALQARGCVDIRCWVVCATQIASR